MPVFKNTFTCEQTFPEKIAGHSQGQPSLYFHDFKMSGQKQLQGDKTETIFNDQSDGKTH